MANCITCKARCENAGQHRVKTDCISYMPKDYPKPTTNYDRIKSKTPEELADYLIQYGACPPERMYPDSCPNCDRVTPKVCYDCWLDWLKQEAEEGE